jgi:Tfp pilus assembly protein PilF
MAAEAEYAAGDIAGTERYLRRTLAANPRHVPAQLLLAQVHLQKGHAAEAVAAMESVYAAEPAAARDGLVAALLAYLSTQNDTNEQWQTISRVLRLNPDLPAARLKRDEILRCWAGEAAAGKEFEAALNAFQQMDDKSGTTAVRTRLRWQAMTKRLLSRLEPSK